jgi:phospholipase/lecithinase/hemolysin
MSIHSFSRKIFTLALVFLSLCAVAQADYSAVVAYGDSLSDNGNLSAYLLSHLGVVFPPPPNFAGHRSNGPVAVEQLAAALGIPLVDAALLGATTGVGNVGDPGVPGTPTSLGALGLPGMQAEIPLTPPGVFNPLVVGSELFVVWGGADDLLSPSPLDTTLQEIANRAVTNIDAFVLNLQALGAQTIFVPGIPDLGLTPAFQAQGPIIAAGATAYSNLVNAGLAATLPAGATYFDTAGLFAAIAANPAAYGLTNVTDPCFNELAATLCGNPGQYLFWDSFHPTTAADAIAAAAFASAVPEPSSIVLLLTACALGIGARKRLFAGR